MENQPQTEKKMPLSQIESRELRAYIFISRPVNIQIQNEGVHLIFSFDLDRAVVKAIEMAPKEFFVKQMGFITAKDLISKIEIGEATVVSPEKPIRKELTKEQFICDLKLIAEEFLKGEDKEKLKEIIGRIK